MRSLLLFLIAHVCPHSFRMLVGVCMCLRARARVCVCAFVFALFLRYMDFLLIHLHPNRATRFNFLRNDATFTSSQLRNMSTTGGSSTGSLQSQSSLASISSAGSSSTASLHSTGSSVSMTDRHGAAPAVKPVVARSTSNQSNFSLSESERCVCVCVHMSTCRWLSACVRACVRACARAYGRACVFCLPLVKDDCLLTVYARIEAPLE